MKSRAARTTLGIVVGGALIAGGAVFTSTASAGEHPAPAPATAPSPAAPKNPVAALKAARAAAPSLNLSQQHAMGAAEARSAGEKVLSGAALTELAPALTPGVDLTQTHTQTPKKSAPQAVEPALADDPTDTTAPTGSYKLSLTSVWIGQRITLTDLGVSDDVSGPEGISRVVSWGDGNTTALIPGSGPIGKRYYTAGKFTVSVTLTDEAGNSSTAALANAVVTTTKPGKFKISPTSVLNFQRFTLAISSVPAGTTKINVAWGDGYGSSLAGKNQTIGKRYYIRSNGAVVKPGTMTLTATFTNKNGATSAFVIGKVINKRDLTKPVVKLTIPKKANHRSSWTYARGTATDTGSGIVANKVAVVVARVDTSLRFYCYTAKKTWVRDLDETGDCGVIWVPVTKGKWSLQLKGLTIGAIWLRALTGDYSDNVSNLAERIQELDY